VKLSGCVGLFVSSHMEKEKYVYVEDLGNLFATIWLWLISTGMKSSPMQFSRAADMNSNGFILQYYDKSGENQLKQKKKKNKIYLGNMMQKLVIGHVSTTRGYNCSLIVDVGKIHEASCGSCTKKSQLCNSSFPL